MRRFSKEWMLVGVFIFLFALMSILSPDKFLSLNNLQSMAFQLPEFGLLSLAMMVVIVTGGINLSLTSTAALSGIMGAFALSIMNSAGFDVGLTIAVAIVVSVLTSLLCGLINGSIISYIGVSPILVTLGTMTLFEGISLNFTKGGAISGFPEQYYWFGNGTILQIPVPMIIFIVFIVLTYIMLEHTPWGLCVYMSGCNPLATMYSGINVKKVLLKVYLFSALLTSVSSVIMTSRYNSAKVDYGSSYLLQSITAVVLGGTNIAGGYGKVMGTVTATLILQVLSSGLNLLGVKRYIVDVIMGAILILILAINFINSNIKFKTKNKSHNSDSNSNLIVSLLETLKIAKKG
ncbi:MAG TPA: ABC transporter permease [Clostridiaceae bacterium]|nr:ABC transporter permease [Clostridiaceae bacterium]